jgi:subtilisin family serine protease
LADGGLCTTTGNWAGKVVLCSRGDISFYDKVRNVQNSGGVAAIIYNNVPNEDLFATLGAGNSSTIIAVSTTMETGQFLLTKVGIDATVSSVYEWPVSGYEAWSGTSMATPHVAGVAALIWSANPGWTNVQIREALTETAFDLGPAGRDIAYGYGLVQAVDALAHLEGGVEPPPPPPDTQLSVEIISPEEGATVSGSVLFEVRVTAGLEAVPGAAVTLTLTGAKSAPVTLTGVTDANGTFSLTYTINSRRMGTGTYTLSVSATKVGYLEGSATRTFIVQ